MGDEEAAAAPEVEAPKEYKLRSIGDEGAPASLEDVDGEKDVVLVAGDKQFVVARAAAEAIPLIAKVLEAEDPDKGAPKEEVHLGQVTSIALPVVKPDVAATVLEYVERTTGVDEAELARIEKPLRGKVDDLLASDWSKKLVLQTLINEGNEKEHDKLFDTLAGAHVLGVKPLEDLCGLAVASLLKGKTPEEIRELFGLEGDFQPEEVEKIKEDTKWATTA